MLHSSSDRAVFFAACFLNVGLVHAEWNSVGGCGNHCATAGQACADSAAFHNRGLLAMYPGYSMGRLVGYFCDLDPNPINIGDSFTGPVCDPLTEAKDATTTGGCVARVQTRQLGEQCGQVGNPVTIVNGSKYLDHTDFESGGYEHLTFSRFYNSLEQSLAVTTLQRTPLLGVRWRTNWDSSLGFISTAFAIARRADGQEIRFGKSQGQWVLSNSYLDLPYRLVESGGNFQLIDGNDTTETFDASGKLLSRRTLSGYTQSLTYAPDSKLTDITDSYGRALHFTYVGNYVSTMTVPGGLIFRFEYQPLNNYAAEPQILRAVIYSDGTPGDLEDNPRLTYLYEDARFPQAVTGVVDENSNRFATYSYDEQGRAIATTHSGGADSFTLAYTATNTRTVTNPLGKQTIYHYTTIQDVQRVTEVEGVANGTCDAASKNYTYHPATGMLTSRTDWKGSRTDYVHNARGLQESRTEAAGTPLARTITTAWHPDFRLPTTIVAPGLTTNFSYDGGGRLLTRTETDTTNNAVPYSTNGQQRSWSYTYNGSGQVETVDGPRTDVQDKTTYGYDGFGNLVHVTNALNHTTHITAHDPRGLPLTVVEPNNMVTTLTYNERGWLMSQTTGGATTQLAYEPTGSISRVTLPSGGSFSYEYDAAQRLTAIENNAGERVELALDGLGNVTAIVLKDGDGDILYRHHRAFDAIGRLLQDIGAQGQTATFGYDKNDNQTSILNARQFTSFAAFDALDRLYETTDPLGHKSHFSYDARDNLVGVNDPRGVSTTYVHNGFGELIYEASADAGNITIHRDDAGNVVRRSDARGVITRFTYDALQRIVTESLPRGPSENRRYLHDNPTVGEHGIGRLHRIMDDSGSTTYVYDVRGNVIKSTRFIKGFASKGVSYVSRFGYDLNDQVIQLAYPSGRIVDYERDAMGRVTRVTTHSRTGGLPVQIATAITYNPYGAMTGWVYGNGLTGRMSYDLDYRLVESVVSDGTTDLYHVHLSYDYDASGNIETITDAIAQNRDQSFAYDPLDRLIEASSGSEDDGMYGVESFEYDAAGNRLTKSAGGVSESYSYGATSNRLISISQGAQTERQFTYDAAGNTVADSASGGAIQLLAYNHAGRYTRIDKNGQTVAAYRHNAIGERVMKATMSPALALAVNATAAPGGGTQWPLSIEKAKPIIADDPDDRSVRNAAPSQLTETHYHYDLNKMLIAESTGAGTVLREYVYLPDEPAGFGTLLAQVDRVGGGTRTNQLSFVTSDHLRTPVMLADRDRQIVWQRTQEPFGETVAEQGSSGTNLRFPGQYFDPESGYHYNMFRDYEPRLGRYLQSDPIGIAGGLTRYNYVEGNPLEGMDPLGLAVYLCRRPADFPFPLSLIDHYWIKTDTVEAGMGAAPGVIPAQGGNWDWPYTPTRTVSHEGQSTATNATCERQNNVDEPCVNNLIKPDQETGAWTPFNQCENFAYGVVAKCRYGMQKGPEIPNVLRTRGPIGTTLAP